VAPLVALLSGGTGGAKLARGLLEVCDDLVVIANTGDDVDMYGVHVSPDPDLVTYWLADEIDERGYGLRGDTFEVMAALEAAGRPAWFRLGDRDLAMCLIRSERLQAGQRLTEAHAAVAEAMGVETRVLPMSDQPVSTWVGVADRLLPFQEYMIVAGAPSPIEAVELRGVDAARPTDEVLLALAEADAIVVGPSNPVASIGPILALPGMREALVAAPAPVVAVSPLVGGRSLKGPTEAFCTYAEIELSATGIARAYGEILDGIVADEGVAGVAGHVTETRMDTVDASRRLAAETLEFADSLRE
jgi:LPPG:FO 2-phospho-L-lactate transferase